MRVELFDYDLPQDLIASAPASPRDSARLLYIPTQGAFSDLGVRDLPTLLRRGDVMVFNDTKVIPARLFGQRGDVRVEILLHRFMGDGTWTCFAKPAKRLKDGQEVVFAPDFKAIVAGRAEDGQVVLKFDTPNMFEMLEKHGELPLPPYMQRRAGDADKTSYQTAYAENPGSVAAPTAGLHFTPELLKAVDDAGVTRVHVTLHVGAGTFLPVKAEDTRDHIMHAEWWQVDEEAAGIINAAKREGRRVVAVGTTSLRTLESSAAETGFVRAGAADTRLFITPGYDFKVVDALMTNFHLPKSTLLMLVSALAGRERMLDAYAHAIAQRYRFFSYGDSSFIERI